jgi:ribosome biogenesis protein SSF1/2
MQVAGQLGVTQFLMFGKTEKGTTLRIARYPRGPTLTFRVASYSLTRDVLSSQNTPRSPGTEYLTSPLVWILSFSPGMMPMSTVWNILLTLPWITRSS